MWTRPCTLLLQYNMSFSITDNSLMSNIQKLFSEKIEIFSAVDFSKVSVLTGIIKISLKVHFSRKHFCPFRNYWKTYYIKLCFIILYKLNKEYTTSAFLSYKCDFPNWIWQAYVRWTLYQYTVHVLIFDTWKYRLFIYN